MKLVITLIYTNYQMAINKSVKTKTKKIIIIITKTMHVQICNNERSDKIKQNTSSHICNIRAKLYELT
jgi:hypothetical protein